MLLQVHMFLTQFGGLSSVSPDFPEVAHRAAAAAWFGRGVCPIWKLLAFYPLGYGGWGNIDHMTATRVP